MTVLSLQNIAKNFGAIQAIVDVSFNIKEAEIVGLMGDNGVGKFTLLKIIAGNFNPSAGSIKFEDQEVHFKKPIESREAGIEVVYQDNSQTTNFIENYYLQGCGPVYPSESNKNSGNIVGMLES